MSPLKTWMFIGAGISVLIFLWVIHHHGYNAGRDHVRAQWKEEKAALALQVDVNRATRQDKTDTLDDYGIKTFMDALAKNEPLKEETENAVKASRLSDCVVPDRVRDAYNNQVHAGKR